MFKNIAKTKLELMVDNQFMKKIESYIYPEFKFSYLLFLDGVFLKQYSNYDSNILVNKIIRKNKFSNSSDNIAFGYKISVEENVIIENPHQIIHISSEKLKSFEIIISLGKESRLSLLETFFTSDNFSKEINYLLTSDLSKNSSFSHYMLVDDAKNLLINYKLRSKLEENSHFSFLSFSSGIKKIHQDCRVNLLSSKAKARIRIGYLAKNNSEINNKVKIVHTGKDTCSCQIIKGVLKDGANSTFDGTIRVEKHAELSNSKQINHNLVLDDNVICKSIPKLEIFADNIKSSHGVTIAKIDDEKLDYLVNRGICKRDAKKLLILAFCREISNLIEIQSIKKKVNILTENFVRK